MSTYIAAMDAMTARIERSPEMDITPATLTRAAAAAAVASGAIFIGIQIGHPELNATSIATTNVEVRDYLKVIMCGLALAGITGMYLSQVRRNGVLGLVGYVVLAAAYLGIMCVVFAAAFVMPEVAKSNPGYVNDVIAINTGRSTAIGDIGTFKTVIQLQGFAYLAGCLIFGIALFRARMAGTLGCRSSRSRWHCQRSSLGDARCLLSAVGSAHWHCVHRSRLLAVAHHPHEFNSAAVDGRDPWPSLQPPLAQ